MTSMFRIAAATLAVVASLGVAAAQQQPGSAQQENGSQPASPDKASSPGDKAMNSQTSPGQTPPATSNQATQASPSAPQPPTAPNQASQATPAQQPSQPASPPKQATQQATSQQPSPPAGPPEQTTQSTPQQPSQPPASSQATPSKPQQPGQPPAPGSANPQAAAAPAAKGPAFVNGALAAPGAPKDGPTVPAKYSKKNAELDKLPLMARPLPLNDAQKQQLIASVSKTKPESTNVPIKPSDELPIGLTMHKLPPDVAKQIPLIARYQYVRLKDKVLLVVAPNRIVVAEFDTNGK